MTEINFEFRPESLNGILLLSGEKEDLSGDFMIVTLNNGFIEFLFDCGSGRGVIRSIEKVNLHQWNSLIIYRYRWDAWIELNEKRRNRGRSFGIFSRITFRKFLFYERNSSKLIKILNISRYTSFYWRKRKFHVRDFTKEENSHG